MSYCTLFSGYQLLWLLSCQISKPIYWYNKDAFKIMVYTIIILLYKYVANFCITLHHAILLHYIVWHWQLCGCILLHISVGSALTTIILLGVIISGDLLNHDMSLVFMSARATFQTLLFKTIYFHCRSQGISSCYNIV